MRLRVVTRRLTDLCLCVVTADSEDDSGYDPSVTHDEHLPRQPAPPAPPAEGDSPGSPADLDRVTSEVRGHLENVVETLLGESIQSASIRPDATGQ